jgi:hypothetical protein
VGGVVDVEGVADVVVVGDHDQGGPMAFPGGEHERDDRVAGMAVQLAGRLVGEQHGGPAG